MQSMIERLRKRWPAPLVLTSAYIAVVAVEVTAHWALANSHCGISVAATRIYLFTQYAKAPVVVLVDWLIPAVLLGAITGVVALDRGWNRFAIWASAVSLAAGIVALRPVYASFFSGGERTLVLAAHLPPVSSAEIAMTRVIECVSASVICGFTAMRQAESVRPKGSSEDCLRRLLDNKLAVRLENSGDKDRVIRWTDFRRVTICTSAQGVRYIECEFGEETIIIALKEGQDVAELAMVIELARGQPPIWTNSAEDLSSDGEAPAG
jgi:hypothetical protein